MPNAPDLITTFIRGNKFFELSKHLGNVLVTITDRKIAVQEGSCPTPLPPGLVCRPAPTGMIDYYLADIVTANDYYPFGMVMPGRKVTHPNGSYRYGFNGKEKDPNIASDNYDFGARIYDPRLARWLAVDPLQIKYLFLSPFVFALNAPIQAKDPDGKLVIFVNGLHGGTAYKPYWEGFDDKIMKRIGDKKSRYYDGALGDGLKVHYQILIPKFHYNLITVI